MLGAQGVAASPHCCHLPSCWPSVNPVLFLLSVFSVASNLTVYFLEVGRLFIEYLCLLSGLLPETLDTVLIDRPCSFS